MDRRIHNALLFIEQNIKSDISLEMLADAAGVSAYHFHRMFKMETGETPAQKILKTKILRAAHDLLILSQMSVIDAALEYGFSSPSVFARSFKKIVGKSPTRFRKDRRAELGLDEHPNVQKLEREYRKSVRLPVRYLDAKKLRIQATAFSEDNIRKTYDDLIKNCPEGVTHAIAVFVEPPFGNRENRFHLVGYDQHVPDATGKTAYELQSGYYTSFKSVGDFDQMQKAMLANRKTYIEPSNFETASTVFFERVPLSRIGFDYFAANRELFVMVRKK